MIIGVDPARDGDRTVITFRRGREVPIQYVWDPAKGETMDQMKLVGIVAKYIEKHEPAAVFIDVAEGDGAVDRLHELGYSEIVHGIFFGSGAAKDQVYGNKRAEMYGDLEEWLETTVSIPDDDQLHVDLSVIPKFKTTSSSRKLLPPKADIKEESGFSPDLADSLALTFALPVRAPNSTKINHVSTKSPLKTLRRVRKA